MTGCEAVSGAGVTARREKEASWIEGGGVKGKDWGWRSKAGQGRAGRARQGKADTLVRKPRVDSIRDGSSGSRLFLVSCRKLRARGL